MRFTAYALLVLWLLVPTAFGQVGRLAGSIYPGDRGARSSATLNAVCRSLGTNVVEWVLDGAWVISKDASFRKGDTVKLLPGASFSIAADAVVYFNGASLEGWNGVMFSGLGTTDGTASYPRRFNVWGDAGQYNLTVGYLELLSLSAYSVAIPGYSSFIPGATLGEFLHWFDVGSVSGFGVSNLAVIGSAIVSNTVSGSVITNSALYRQRTAVVNQILASSTNNVYAVGSMTYCASTSAPANWLLCDGSYISTGTYSALFAVIGTNFGVGVSTNFPLPYMTGSSLMGHDARSSDFSSLMYRGGAETHTLIAAELPSHTHTPSINEDESDGTTDEPLVEPSTGADRTGVRGTSSTGGSGPHNNMQPYTVLNVIIRY